MIERGYSARRSPWGAAACERASRGQVNDALGLGDPKEKLAECDNIPLTREDVQRLLPGEQ